MKSEWCPQLESDTHTQQNAKKRKGEKTRRNTENAPRTEEERSPFLRGNDETKRGHNTTSFWGAFTAKDNSWCVHRQRLIVMAYLPKKTTQTNSCVAFAFTAKTFVTQHALRFESPARTASARAV